MPELRWILIAAGILILLSVYFWGRRIGPRTGERETILRSRAEPLISAPELEPTAPDPYANEAYAIDPDLTSSATTHSPPTIQPEQWADSDELEDLEQPTVASRREPVFSSEPVAIDADDEPTISSAEPVREASQATSQSEPALDADSELEPEPESQASVEAARPSPSVTKPAHAPTPRKILVLRLACSPSRIPGDKLRAAFNAQGLTFGKYEIFHLVHGSGETLFSVASMVEPGTFDLAHMDSTPYLGVTLFAQLPSTLPGHEVLDELLRHAKLLQGAVGGTLQDERGGLLNSPRIQRLRQEVIDFEHLCHTAGEEVVDSRAS